MRNILGEASLVRRVGVVVVALVIGWTMVASPVQPRMAAAAADGFLCGSSVEGPDHDLIVGYRTIQTVGSSTFERLLA